MRITLCVLALLLLAAPAYAHHSSEELWMGVQSWNAGTRTYTLYCDPAPRVGALKEGALRYWTVRPDQPAAEAEFYTEGNTLTYTLSKDVLYHIGCQVEDANGILRRGDFHIDYRTGPIADGRPNVAPLSAEGLTTVVQCTPPQGVTNYHLYWHALSLNGSIEFKEFEDQTTATISVPWPMIWDIDCSVYNIDTGQTTQWGLPLEFFSFGPAYIANKEGCMPNHSCVASSDGSNQPPQAPTWIEPSEGKSDVDPTDFHIHVNPMVDAESDEHIAIDFEIWDAEANERVWSSLHNTAIKNHIHNADGTFEGRLAGMNKLENDRAYKVRARFYETGDIVSSWSERNFRTKEVTTGGEVGDGTVTNGWWVRSGYHLETVATNVNLPVNVVPAPDIYTHLPESQRPLLYVSQLYGQLGMIRKDGSYVQYASNLLNYDSFGSLPGAGEMGVIGIYVDPSSGDVYASYVYYEDNTFKGKVEKFITNDNGDGFVGRQTILKDVIVSPSHQVQQITRGPDGKLYMNTGDADMLDTVQDPQFTNGKILRFNDDGSMPSDNPWPGTYTWAMGFRNHFGLDFRPGTNELWVTHNGPDANDGIYKVTAGYTAGWKLSGDTITGTWHLWPQTTAPTALSFDKGQSGFPSESTGTFYVALSGATYSQGPSDVAKRIVQFKINSDGSNGGSSDFVVYRGSGYSAPIGLSFGPGGMYFTDMYGEIGFTGIGETKGNIYRIVSGDGPGDTDGNSEFTVAIGAARWYPQGLKMIWECKAAGGSGNYRYEIDFGDGANVQPTTTNTFYHEYAANGTYNAKCVIYDDGTGVTKEAQTLLTLGLGQTDVSDTQGPQVTLLSPQDGMNTTASAVDVSFTVTDPTDSLVHYAIYIDNALSAHSSTTNTGTTTMNVALSGGTHAIKVTATDAALNTAESATHTIFIEQTQSTEQPSTGSESSGSSSSKKKRSGGSGAYAPRPAPRNETVNTTAAEEPAAPVSEASFSAPEPAVSDSDTRLLARETPAVNSTNATQQPHDDPAVKSVKRLDWKGAGVVALWLGALVSFVYRRK